MHVGIANPRWLRKTFPAFSAHAQPTILRIWQEPNCQHARVQRPSPRYTPTVPPIPSQSITISIAEVHLQLPILLVLTLHWLPTKSKLHHRMSWTKLSNWSRNANTICAEKLFESSMILQNKADDGRNRSSNYHIKTTFLRYLEKTFQSMITSPSGQV